ncbi:MAG: hypothetical protein QOC76_313 [Mycobacterium sp.]|nr:hypothetical protein [Mycobacterium sp.]
MLLNYTGGKTGNQYAFAIGYFARDDGDVLVSSSANWPKTFGNARDVRLLIKGQWFTAQPKVIKEPEQKAHVLAEFVRRNGVQAAKGLMLGLPGDHQPDRQQLLEAGAKTTFIRFALAPELRHRSQLPRTISSGLVDHPRAASCVSPGSRSRCSWNPLSGVQAGAGRWRPRLSRRAIR